MSLSPLVSFKSRFVTYLLNFSRKLQYIFFSKNHAFYEIMWKKYGRVGQATDANITGECHLHAG